MDTWLAGVIYGITDTISVDIGYGNGFKETNETITAGLVLGF